MFEQIQYQGIELSYEEFDITKLEKWDLFQRLFFQKK